MKKHCVRRLLAGILTAAILAVPALAAEETAPAPQTPDAWAVEYLADSYAMGLVDDGYTSYIKSQVTAEQLERMTTVVGRQAGPAGAAPAGGGRGRPGGGHHQGRGDERPVSGGGGL